MVARVELRYFSPIFFCVNLVCSIEITLNYSPFYLVKKRKKWHYLMLGTRYLASKGSLGLSDYHYQDMQNATLRYSFTPQNKPPKHARKSNKKYVQMHDAVMHTHAILKLNKILCTKKYKTSGRNLQRDFVKYGSTLRWWSI
jgi:hypothetical protein